MLSPVDLNIMELKSQDDKQLLSKLLSNHNELIKRLNSVYKYLRADIANASTGTEIFDDIITKGPWIDVRAYGAKGDGSTDDSVAFQAAIDYIKTVGSGCLFIPIGVYKILTSLDCTGFLGNIGNTYKSLNILGASINGSRILGATSGTPIFDFTASGYCSMENLRITGHSSDIPNVAILLARNSDAGSAGVHNFRRIFVEGEFTKGGIYDFASEENVYDNVRITITGGGATWCIAFSDSNFESIVSAYQTILPGTSPMTRTVIIAPQFMMYGTEATGTCLSIHGDVRDLDCYGPYMYSRAQSHVRMYSPNTSKVPFRISFRNPRTESYATTSKPDYSIFMTGASDGAFSEILVDNAFLGAYIYEIYQDNTVTGTFSGLIDRARTVNATELKFNKVTNSKINILQGDLTVDTSITKSEVNNYHTGTISLAGKDSVITRNFYTRLFQTDLFKRASDIRTLADEATPSVASGNLFKTGGTANDPITDFDDGVTGQRITIFAEHSIVVDVDAGNIFLDGAVDFNMDSGDTLSLVCKADNKWYEISRSDNT
jgi:hypothetical protein